MLIKEGNTKTRRLVEKLGEVIRNLYDFDLMLNMISQPSLLLGDKEIPKVRRCKFSIFFPLRHRLEFGSLARYLII
jgi:hypothetical protein